MLLSLCVFLFLGDSLRFYALIDRSGVHLDRFLCGLHQLEFGLHILKLHGNQSRWRQDVASGRTDRSDESNTRFSQLLCESANKLMNDFTYKKLENIVEKS
jgi:hypothetical protein